jgi:hypothetical protein
MTHRRYSPEMTACESAVQAEGKASLCRVNARAGCLCRQTVRAKHTPFAQIRNLINANRPRSRLRLRPTLSLKNTAMISLRWNIPQNGRIHPVPVMDALRIAATAAIVCLIRFCYRLVSIVRVREPISHCLLSEVRGIARRNRRVSGRRARNPPILQLPCDVPIISIGCVVIARSHFRILGLIIDLLRKSLSATAAH